HFATRLVTCFLPVNPQVTAQERRSLDFKTGLRCVLANAARRRKALSTERDAATCRTGSTHKQTSCGWEYGHTRHVAAKEDSCDRRLPCDATDSRNRRLTL